MSPHHDDIRVLKHRAAFARQLAHALWREDGELSLVLSRKAKRLESQYIDLMAEDISNGATEADQAQWDKPLRLPDLAQALAGWTPEAGTADGRV
jgi:uncharacterized protein YceH (UPF0502 family)